jgi:asparagine synthase (glutamine-hydrolysing)
VSADLLGLFPVYYYAHQEVFLLASSPELFRHHPSFQPKFNPRGLVGLLLTNGFFDGQTLWQDIHRLGAGYVLHLSPHHPPKETQQYQLPTDDAQNPYRKISLGEQGDILEQVLKKTLDHHLQPQQEYNLLLSGGLDSRMLAGFMTRQGIKPTTLTLGEAGDLEMQCAQGVAKCLGLTHHQAPTIFSQFPEYLRLTNLWEHLANGANGIAIGWGIVPHLQNLPPRVVTGLCLDVAFSGPLPVAYPGETFSFDLFLKRRVTPWGFTPELLQQLLKPEVFGDLVPETIAKIRQVYESYSPEEYTRNLCFEYYHRERFHTGSGAWIFSFGATPVLPVLDRELLAVTALLPRWDIDRLAQQQLVITRFPDLAKLPIDRNDYNTLPLLIDRLPRLTKKWYEARGNFYKLRAKLGRDRRFYYHIFDTNNPGWQAVRQLAEPQRSVANALFNPNILGKILPPADTQLKFSQDTIIESSRVKLLTAFLLWAEHNL